jgi:hypothetical protein
MSFPRKRESRPACEVKENTRRKWIPAFPEMTKGVFEGSRNDK